MVRSQQRRNRRRDGFGIAAAQRQLDCHQFVLAAFFHFLQRHLGDQALGEFLRHIDQGQHAFAADERVAFGQQHAVQQIERFRHRVVAAVGIVEGPWRRGVQDERQVGLFGKPLQDIRPALVAEGETQPLFRRFGHRLGSLAGGFGFGCFGGRLGASAAGAGVASAGLGASAAGAGFVSAGLGISAAGAGVASAGLGASAAGVGAAAAGLGASAAGAGFASAGLGASAAGAGFASAGLGASAAGAGFASAGLGVSAAGAGAASAGLGASAAGAGAGVGGLGRLSSRRGCCVGGLGRLGGRRGCCVSGLGRLGGRRGCCFGGLGRLGGWSSRGCRGRRRFGLRHASVAGPSASNVTNNHRRLTIAKRSVCSTAVCLRKKAGERRMVKILSQAGTLAMTRHLHASRLAYQVSQRGILFRLSMFGREAKLASSQDTLIHTIGKLG